MLKITSEKEVKKRYKLLTLLILRTLRTLLSLLLLLTLPILLYETSTRTPKELSSPIFLCLSVSQSVCKASVTHDQISTFYRTRIRSLATLITNSLTNCCLVVNATLVTKTRCQIWCTIELHRDPISKVL